MEIRKFVDDIPLIISLAVRLKVSFRNENKNQICWTCLNLAWNALKRLQKDKMLLKKNLQLIWNSQTGNNFNIN